MSASPDFRRRVEMAMGQMEALSILRQKNERLQAENEALRKALEQKVSDAEISDSRQRGGTEDEA